MNCRQIEEMLWFYVEKSLPDEKMKEVEQHLSVCPDCLRLAEEFSITDELLKGRRNIKANPFLYTRTIQKIENQKIKVARNPLPRLTERIILIAAAAIIGIILGINLINHSGVVSYSNVNDLSLAQDPLNELWYGEPYTDRLETYYETLSEEMP